MKKIECYIQPYNLDMVAEALAVEGVVGMSVAEVKGFGVQRGFTRGEEVQPGQYRFHPKMKVEMVVPDSDVERIVEAIVAFPQEQPDRRGQDLRPAGRRGRAHAHQPARRGRHQIAGIRGAGGAAAGGSSRARSRSTSAPRGSRRPAQPGARIRAGGDRVLTLLPHAREGARAPAFSVPADALSCRAEAVREARSRHDCRRFRPCSDRVKDLAVSCCAGEHQRVECLNGRGRKAGPRQGGAARFSPRTAFLVRRGKEVTATAGEGNTRLAL